MNRDQIVDTIMAWEEACALQRGWWYLWLFFPEAAQRAWDRAFA